MGPISSYQILSCLDVNLDNRVDRGKFFGCQKIFPINTIASTIGTIASDRMTSYQSATKRILSCLPIVLIGVDVGQEKQHDLLRCVAIYYDL